MLEDIEDSVVTDADFLEIIKNEVEFIKTFCLDEKAENISPMLKVWDSKKQLQLVPLTQWEDFNKSVGRRQILVEVGAYFYKEWGSDVFPAIVMLTSEAWMKSFDPKSMPDKIRMPSDYPDAIDSVVVQAITLAKSSILESEPNPRAGMAVLEIKARKPYIHLEELVEPNISAANRESTDLLNHFFMGWLQAGIIDRN